MRYGIFGGTFDPVHVGHVRVAIEAKEHLGLDAVLFVPARRPPHKQAGTVSASAEHRLAMLRLAVRPWRFMKVLDYEIRKDGVGYTVDTVRHIRGRFGAENEYFLLIGSDWAGDIEGWKDYDLLRRWTRIVVFPRGRTAARTGDALALPCPVLRIASTDLRRSPGMKLRELFLPPAVLDYVRSRGLYFRGRGRRRRAG